MLFIIHGTLLLFLDWWDINLFRIQAGIYYNDDDIDVASIEDDEYASACSSAGDHLSQGSMLGGRE